MEEADDDGELIRLPPAIVAVVVLVVVIAAGTEADTPAPVADVDNINVSSGALARQFIICTSVGIRTAVL